MATNTITAMTPEKARIPVGLPTDRAAVEAALKTIGAIAPLEARIIHIKNTLEMGTFHISHSLKAMIKDRKDLVLSKEIGPLSFDHDGGLSPIS